MKLNKIIKGLRVEKKLSQSFIAHELFLEQSQYCRREKGEIHFTPDEIIKISQVLGTTIAILFGEEVSKPVDQNKEFTTKYVTVPEKFIEDYELLLNKKDDEIKVLRQKLGNSLV
ncbi:hypothetical protein AR687_22665 [Flavobacteriaceae bacterium CRH]|nr:hypothetical protein AR687_22665 [Flavobacteriaceae bacterium CRH]